MPHLLVLLDDERVPVSPDRQHRATDVEAAGDAGLAGAGVELRGESRAHLAGQVDPADPAEGEPPVGAAAAEGDDLAEGPGLGLAVEARQDGQAHAGIAELEQVGGEPADPADAPDQVAPEGDGAPALDPAEAPAGEATPLAPA